MEQDIAKSTSWLDQLENSGLAVIGSSEASKERVKTLIVVGVARGGTSMIAGCLSQLGLFGGERCGPPVFEDVHLSEAFHHKDEKLASSIIEKYNGNHSEWFFKRPGSVDYLQRLHVMLRNPVFIFVFRDIFSVSNRNRLSMGMEIKKGLSRAHRDYSTILQFLSDHDDINGVLVSYEKALLNPSGFIDQFTSLLFTDQVPPARKNKAINFIEPSPEQYLDSTRANKTSGAVESISRSQVVGWAKRLYDQKPADVRLYRNNQLIGTQTADATLKYLPDEQREKGFVFMLDPELTDGDKISIRFAEDGRELNGSPLVHQASLRRGERVDPDRTSIPPWLIVNSLGCNVDYLTDWVSTELEKGSVGHDFGPGSSMTSEHIRKGYRSGDALGYWRNRGNPFSVVNTCDQAGRYAGLIPSHRTVAFINEPVSNVLESYDYQVRFNGYNKPLEAFIEEPRFRNAQSRRIRATPAELIGILLLKARLAESLPLLADSLGIEFSNYKHDRSTDARSIEPSDISNDMLARLKANNESDIKLYDHGLSSFETRLLMYQQGQPFTHGYIQTRQPRHIAGCAFISDSDDPVSVDIYRNGEHIKTLIASDPRPHLMAYLPPRSGYVGFTCHLSDPLQDDEVIECKVSATGQLIQ